MLVIGNGRMITQDASNPFLENGAVAMDGNTIVMVGVTEEVKKVIRMLNLLMRRVGLSCRHLLMPMSISTAPSQEA